MNTPDIIIAPSMLSGDFARLADEAGRLKEAGADWLHMDVMDGHFVPNLTLGAPVVAALRKHTTAYLDCHLMVSKPAQWLADFQKAGASGFTFHVETCDTVDEVLKLARAVREAGMKVGIALKPGTAVEPYLEVAAHVDMVLVMTVEPGFGGQKCMPENFAKVQLLRQHYPNLLVQVDGGIILENVKQAAAAGANVIVSGSGLFGQPDLAEAISKMRSLAHSATQ